ncbi:MAG: sodium/solute symporter [Planctomycetota bacterium]
MSLWFSDWVVIALYGLVIAVVAFVLVRKSGTAEGYFLAGRSLTWPFIGASLFAANISAEHIVGLAGAGWRGGMAVGGFEWMAIYCMIPLILLFLPFYIRNKIFTVPEFLEQRFSPGVRMFFSGFMVIVAVLVKVSISLWAASIFFDNLLGWNRIWTIWIVGLATAVYTMKGGLRVVVYTDALQSVVLLVAAVVLTTLGLRQVGGWSGLHEKLGPEMFQMVKPLTDVDYPWFGMFFGVFVLGSFYWSMDQVLVQRAFAAKDLNEGRLGAIFCGFLKLATPFLLVVPGLIAKCNYPSLPLIPGSENPDTDLAYPTLLRDLMPHGLLGLTFAGVVAALMGHLSATYNSIATLVTRDFYLHWRPQASQNRQVLVGRIVVLAVCALGALWAPIIGNFQGLWNYLQSVQAYLMMPVAAVFFFGVLWKRTTTAGVTACFVAAAVLGPIFMYNNQLVIQGKQSFLPLMDHWLLKPWLHTAFFNFLVCSAILVAVSLITRPASTVQLATTTVSDWKSLLAAERVPLYRNYLFWLGLLLTICTALWYTMR